MKRGVIIPKPKRLFDIDPTALDEMHEIFGGGHSRVIRLEKGFRLTGNDFAEYGRLMLLARPLLRHCVSAAGLGLPINFELDSYKVSPGTTQRIDTWHTDGFLRKPYIVITFSSALPTVYASGTIPQDHPLYNAYHTYKNLKGAPLKQLRLVDEFSSAATQLHILTNTALQEGVLVSEPVDANAAYAFTDQHIHIGNNNPTSSSVPRLFGRISPAAL